MIRFFNEIFQICFQIPVLSIDNVIGLLIVLTFLISTIRFQNAQFNCCSFQQVCLAVLLVLWSQVPPNSVESQEKKKKKTPKKTTKWSAEVINLKIH